MSPDRLLRAVLEPVSAAPLLLTLLLFWVLGCLGVALLRLFTSDEANTFLLGLLGALFIAGVLLPAVLRYLLSLIEERALRRPLPVVGTEHFMLFSQPRRLFAVLLVMGWSYLFFAVHRVTPPAAAWLVTGAAAVLLPLQFSLLALTDSPVQSVNPAALVRLLRRLLPDWLWLAALLLVAIVSLRLLAAVDEGGYWRLLLALYWLLAVANVCGLLLARIDIAGETDIAVPLPVAPGRQAALDQRQQQKVLNHAYALLSRGNLEGGFAHLRESAGAANEPLLVELAFFNAMLGWSLPDVPLHYARELLPRLLDAGQHAIALKVTVQCLHRNSRFRPRPEDLPRLLAVAAQAGHEDVQRALKS
ncbi:hypothetical protein [Woeseia oceani]|uniref:Uncharacterized protein n=1 Tax=Woeseia oceani TaxID=1548547 RepID=A0A193LHK3_9GAMM|nr:hypothetical protein [Woeseia oceani]ANO51992.1 hypothetical protein BA177_12990 [Woeseia oceani]